MLKIVCLDGQLQGESFSIFDGFTLSSSKDDHLTLDINDKYVISARDDGGFTINSTSQEPTISSGGQMTPSLLLMPGLIFVLGDFSFAIQTDDEASEKTVISEVNSDILSFEDFLKKAEGEASQVETSSEQFLQKPVTFQFVRGDYINQEWLIPYLPMSFGKKSLFKFFLDESIDTDEPFLTLESEGSEKSIYLSSPFEKLVYVNGSPITKEEVFDGDFVEFGETAFYINRND